MDAFWIIKSSFSLRSFSCGDEACPFDSGLRKFALDHYNFFQKMSKKLQVLD